MSVDVERELDELEKRLKSHVETEVQRLRVKLSGLAEEPSRRTNVEVVEQILKENGRIMHVDEIIDAAGKLQIPLAKNTISVTLHQKARADKIFFREPGNLFGLLEWKEKGLVPCRNCRRFIEQGAENCPFCENPRMRVRGGRLPEKRDLSEEKGRGKENR